MNIEEAIVANVRLLKVISEKLNAMGDTLYLTACKYRRLEEADAELMDKIRRFRVLGHTMYREMVDRMVVLDPDVKIRAAMSRSDTARDGCPDPRRVCNPLPGEDPLKWDTRSKNGHECRGCGNWTSGDHNSLCDDCNELFSGK